MVGQDSEVDKAELSQDRGDRAADLGVSDEALRTSDVDVALVELAEATTRGSVGSPHWLDLVALVEGRQVPVVRDHPRERHREVVAEPFSREVELTEPAIGAGLDRSLELVAAVQQPVEQLITLRAILAEERAQVLDRRRFERDKAEGLIHALDHAEHVPATDHVRRQEITHPAGRLG